MKKMLSTLTIMFFNIAFSQIGINTDQPEATLDINGNLRIAERGNGDNDEKFLTISDDGIVNERLISNISTRKYRTTIKLTRGQNIIVRNPLAFSNSNITITSRNRCARNMISTFISSGGAIILTGGVARDKKAEYTIKPIGFGEDSYSPFIIIKFNDVISCQGDNGDDTQFNFSFKKLNNTEYEITNNGNVEREYRILWSEL